MKYFGQNYIKYLKRNFIDPCREVVEVLVNLQYFIIVLE